MVMLKSNLAIESDVLTDVDSSQHNPPPQVQRPAAASLNHPLHGFSSQTPPGGVPRRPSPSPYHPSPHGSTGAHLPYPRDSYVASGSGTTYTSHATNVSPQSGLAPPPNQQYMPYRPRPPQPSQSTGSSNYQHNGWQDNVQTSQQSYDPPPSSGRRPYPSVSPAYSREDLSMNQPRVQQQKTTEGAPSREHRNQSKPPSNTRSPAPPERHYSEASLGTKPDSSPATAAADSVNPEDSSQMVSAFCDACTNSIRCSQPRVQCTQCYDYDLCIACFRGGRTSKEHKAEHVVSHVLNTRMLSQEDLTPPKDVVNPEYNPSRSKVNWTIVEATQGAENQDQGPKHFRVLHLHGNDSHARFLTSAKPGHYAITVTLELQISPLLGETDREKFRKDGFEWLRIALGTLNDKKAFYSGRYREDAFQSVSLTEESLPHRLLKDYWWDVVRIPLDQQYMQIHSDLVLSVEGDHEFDTDLGFILQWSNMVAFESLDDAVVKVIVAHIRSVTSSLH